ncbi:3-oxoacyl-ACP reductase family protein [Microbacterium sp.]|uniref:3-oxoacyl-ACP reductase family protein n=1 Tax=Microbacterium sp. TaxID=51671 RepID=UPI0025DA0509|nr:3-oxoacyl-ACP reductase family protein [Microbacterium sp.]
MSAPDRRPVALVTGASRGIGRAIAREVARAGFDVVIGYHEDHEGAEATAAEVVGFGGSAVSVGADLRDLAAGERYVQAALDRFGRLDALVNNAGIARDRRVRRMTDADWTDVLAVDLGGAFSCSRAAVTALAESPTGAIVNVSSIVGMNGNVGQANYAAAKGGLLSLTRSLAREFAPDDITVNAVAPGFVLTDMTLTLPAEIIEANIAATPLARPGEPEDIASVVTWLVSPAARFVTGAVIPVDGGLSL